MPSYQANLTETAEATNLRSHLASKEVLAQRFSDILTFVNNYCGASATLPAENTQITEFRVPQDLQSIKSALALKENPVLTRTVGIALTGTIESYNGAGLSQACAGYSPAECYEAALSYIEEFKARVAAGETFQRKYDFPSISARDWLNRFGEATETAQLLAERRFAAITDDTLRNLKNQPRLTVLDDECEHAATLRTVPRQSGQLSADTDVASRLIEGPHKSEVNLHELLASIAGENAAAQARVEHYDAALPAYPNQGTVNFLIGLDRAEVPQQVILVAGSREIRVFNMLQANDSRIENKTTKTSLSFGVPQPKGVDSKSESPFTATVGEALTAARKEKLLHELGMQESTSLVVMIIPGKFETPQPPPGHFYSETRGELRSLSMFSMREMHTDFGTGTTRNKFQSSTQKFEPQPTAENPARIIVLHCAGIQASEVQ